MLISWLDIWLGPTEILASSFSSIFFQGKRKTMVRIQMEKNCLNDMLWLIRQKVSNIFSFAIFCLWKFEFIYILYKVSLIILYSAYVFILLYFSEDLTSNCLDNKICNAILQIFNNSTLKVERLYGIWDFYFILFLWQCQNSVVRETKPNRSQNWDTESHPTMQPYENIANWQNSCQNSCQSWEHPQQ